MLSTAGFVGIERVDLTAEYRATSWAWHEQYLERADELTAVLGAALYEDKVAAGPRTVGAVDAGLLRRALYFARRPA